MAVRRQLFEFVLEDNGNDSISSIESFKESKESIFVGGVGNATLTASQRTKENQFITVEAFGSTPGLYPFSSDAQGSWVPRGFMNIRLENTFFFVNPDGTDNEGISGTAAPYPISIQYQRSYNSFPRVYIQGGVNFDVTYYMAETMIGDPDSFSGTAFSMSASG